MRRSLLGSVFLILLIACVVGFACLAPLETANAAAYQETIMGFNAAVGDGGWTTGNLGKTWAEGEWVPYQVVLSNVQGTYPNLSGMPNIDISYDFTNQGYRFVDLIRGIQVGTTALTNTQAWPDASGNAMPMTTEAQLNAAQNSTGEYAWTGFTLLDLPLAQIHRDLTGGIGTPTDAVRMIRITPQDLIDNGFETANTIVIYFQLHESRTFVWQHSLQSIYDAAPTDRWGGYVYGDVPFSTDSRQGSGFVPGSSGHAQLEITGKKTVPIPLPPEPAGLVSGLKWLDENADGIKDATEPVLSGWRIHVSGIVDGAAFSTSVLTAADGTYSVPSLTSGTWHVAEAENREVPAETGYQQTFPAATTVVGVATSVVQSVSGQADWAWDVALTEAAPAQGGLNFGNVRYGALTVTKIVEMGGVIGSPMLPTFNITITGPSYPAGNTVAIAGGASYTWTSLLPGDYTVTEGALGSEWTVTVPASPIAVTAGSTATATVTNTYRPGSLIVSKTVDMGGVIGSPTLPTFSITITGPSYPAGDTVAIAGGASHTWSGLIPGNYTVTEGPLGSEWSVTVPAGPVAVPAGGSASATVTNTYRPGSLIVNKVVNMGGVIGSPTLPTFNITITGPSYPAGDMWPSPVVPHTPGVA